MKPDWDRLMQEFKDHPTTLVADVDCTAGGASKCGEVGVEGYPTIKYGDPNNLENYEGERSYGALSSVAKGLKPLCSPAARDSCDSEQTEKLEELMDMDDEELDAQIEEQDARLAAAELEFTERVEELEATFKQYEAEKDAKVSDVKASGVGLMKSVKAHRRKGSAEL